MSTIGIKMTDIVNVLFECIRSEKKSFRGLYWAIASLGVLLVIGHSGFSMTWFTNEFSESGIFGKATPYIIFLDSFAKKLGLNLGISVFALGIALSFLIDALIKWKIELFSKCRDRLSAMWLGCTSFGGFFILLSSSIILFNALATSTPLHVSTFLFFTGGVADDVFTIIICLVVLCCIKVVVWDFTRDYHMKLKQAMERA